MHVNTQDLPLRGLPLGSMVFTLSLVTLLGSSPAFCGQESEVLSVSAALEVNPYLTMRVLTLRSGKRLEAASIASPPTPPQGYELEREVGALSVLEAATLSASTEVAKLLTVPAFDWVFGCSSVSGAMIAGYHDRNGYPNIYTGPANGGVTPLDNSVWGSWSDGSSTYPNIPLAASHQGVDGRTTPGSLDDYWVEYGSSSQDPYLTKGWSQHAWGDAIGDYMKTSQSVYGNTDGATTFYGWGDSSALPLTCDDMETYGISSKDGTYGRKLFYQARGYTVTDCYNQSTDNMVGGGFSFDDFKTEIDAGRPVMLNLEGHTIVGVGYDAASNQIYINDTWDYETHTMPWGGSYSGMKLMSVSIVKLTSSSSTYKLTLKKAGAGSGSISGDGSYPAGANVALTASAGTGSRFSGWSPSPCASSFSMPAADLTCTVTFDLVSYRVSATAGTGGSITPVSQSVKYGSTTTLKVTPKSGYAIASVSGCGGQLSGNIYTTGRIKANCTVAANFSPSYKLTVTKTGSGTVTGLGISCGTDCTESYVSGTQVALTATAASGYRFAGWGGGVCSGTGTCIVSMTSAKSIRAAFAR